ncbi:hypothetical protein PFICI_07123 [Pestalotiopsis fici W106-1]|uniref:Uncharacterized protein n=1 Tax=Pestalotiopsis fici (strain W106-1 / CGMCC3.15140) TaxID=1229662 RepID=W3XAC4_PESFW|nr:uncharacterized protein PFICI_07123 [Pestalotiopsis fici W106-1]ETS82121.1 hypothetical protein PFICI_07123 [Pestalotiopsis fici W106-1]
MVTELALAPKPGSYLPTPDHRPTLADDPSFLLEAERSVEEQSRRRSQQLDGSWLAGWCIVVVVIAVVNVVVVAVRTRDDRS